MEIFQKIDPQKHIYRWYSVGVQNTLVHGIAVVTGWGSLNSSFQQWRTYRVDSLEEANLLQAKIIATRLKKGYSKRDL
jgi:hypothetical protein